MDTLRIEWIAEAMARDGYTALLCRLPEHVVMLTGYQPINHAAEPILHPASTSTLCANMIHNMEPAVYIEGKGGIRLNDNVAVRRDGNELLSAALPRDLDWLVVAE